jgi:hypothetical protein
MSSLGRIIHQTFSDTGPAIDNLKTKLLTLKNNLGSKIILNNAFQSAKIMEKVDEILAKSDQILDKLGL